MQTFLISPNPVDTAKILDNKRLFKQIVEGNQILGCLLVEENRWKNHPAVKMWKGYEYFLIAYVGYMIMEWEMRGYQCGKSKETYFKFTKLLEYLENKKPHWFSDEFFLAHKSNLIRKKPEWYCPIFGLDIPDDLPYIWPDGKK